MKRIMVLVALFVLASFGTVFAALDDTQATTAEKYGAYRLVIDEDNQPWTKEEWEATGHKKQKASGFMHHFRRIDLGIQMEAVYENNKPGALVSAQRFTPDMGIRIKEFKQYFPEIYQLLIHPKAHAFTTYKDLTRHFREDKSPVTLGYVIKVEPPGRSNFYTLLAFNIMDEGRQLKDPKYLDENIYIKEFTIERVWKSAVYENLNVTGSEWRPAKKFF